MSIYYFSKKIKLHFWYFLSSTTQNSLTFDNQPLSEISQDYRHFSLASTYYLLNIAQWAKPSSPLMPTREIIKKFQTYNSRLQLTIFHKRLFAHEKRDVNHIRILQRDWTYINRQLLTWRKHATQWKLDILEGNAQRRRMSLSYPL